MSDTTHASAHHLPQVSGLFHKLADRVQRYRRYRATLVELNMLGEHELADLGLNRSMVRSVAYRAAYED